MNEKNTSAKIWVDETQGLICGTEESLTLLKEQISFLLNQGKSFVEFEDYDYEEQFISRIQIFDSYEEYLNEDEPNEKTSWGELLLILFILSIPVFALIGFINTGQWLYFILSN